jgi:AraC-like DNA-binding protein
MNDVVALNATASGPEAKPADPAPKVEAAMMELAGRIARTVRADGTVEPWPGLLMHRVSAPNELLHSVYSPVLCVIAQGSKEIFLGSERYVYDPAHYLLVTAELPLAAHVVEASPTRPYLSLQLKLDPTLVGSVMVEAGHFSPHTRAAVRGIDASPLDGGLADAVVRLTRLSESPADAGFLAPLVTREIIYRLLAGNQGDRLCHIAAVAGHSYRIAGVLAQLRTNLSQPLHIESLAHELGMSVSAFHHHFKAVTAMSPLQYQKRLRLQEARRLMLAEYLDAATAGGRVGYDDTAYFNREYKRLFGAPPMRDVARLRASAKQGHVLASD